MFGLRPATATYLRRLPGSVPVARQLLREQSHSSGLVDA